MVVMLPPERNESKLPVYETLEKCAKQKAERKPKPPTCACVDTQSSAAHKGKAHP